MERSTFRKNLIHAWRWFARKLVGGASALSSFDQRLLVGTLAIGLVLASVVAALEQAGSFSTLNDWFYQKRAEHFQFFTPKPTDKIIHVDIDDAAIEAIGRWPWPRTTLAKLFEELAIAKPKAVAVDVMFADQASNGGPAETLDNAAEKETDELTTALSHVPNCILPATFAIAQPSDDPATEKAATDLLIENLELDVITMRQTLSQSGVGFIRGQTLNDLYVRARRAAMRERLSRQLNLAPTMTREAMIKSLLPHASLELKSPAIRVMDQEWAQLLAERGLYRFGIMPTNPSLHPVEGSLNQIPLPRFSRAAAGCGFVNFDIFSSPTVKSVPLLVQFDDRLFPQMGFALGCIMADVDLHSAAMTETGIDLRGENGTHRHAAVHAYNSAALDKKVSLIADIPWFGTREWWTMYDWPAHESVVNHISINAVWDIALTRSHIIANNELIDRAINLILGDDADGALRLDPTLAKRYATSRPAVNDFAAREAMAQRTLGELRESGWLEGIAKVPENELSEAEKSQRDNLRVSRDSLQLAVENNHLLSEQLQKQTSALRAKIADKGVLLGWTATGSANLITTTLHSRCPDIVVHGVIANAVINDFWYSPCARWVSILLTMGLGCITALVDARLKPVRAAFAIVALLFLFLLIDGFVLYDYARWLVPMAGPVVVMLLVWAGTTLFRVVMEGMERNRAATDAAAFKQEMQLAQKVQRQLIPREWPDMAGIDAQGWSIPASMTGGDMFDLWKMSDGRLGILVADASGHGLAPAMVVSQVRTMVRVMSELRSHPHELFTLINARLAADLNSIGFVTAFLAFLSPDGTLEWTSAGHGPMFIRTSREADITQLEATGLPLGVLDDWMDDGPPKIVRLETGGQLLIISDGIYEAYSPQREQYGIDRVQTFFNVNAHQSVAEFLENVRQTIQAWQGRDEPNDDQTVVLVARPV